MADQEEFESRIRYPVKPLTQKHAYSCWHAGALMLLEGTRIRYLTRGIPISLPEGSHPLENPKIIEEFQKEKLLADNRGLPVKNIAKFLKKVDFESKYTAVNPYLVQDMLTEHGPLLHMTKWHSRVITGITIIDPQTAELEYIDPADGTRRTKEFTQFFIDHPGLPQNTQQLLMYVSPAFPHRTSQKKSGQSSSPAVPDAGLPDANIAPDAGPSDMIKNLPAGIPESQKTGTDTLDAGVVSDLSERIKILPDLEGKPHGVQELMASAESDLSERIRIIPDLDEKPHVSLDDHQASVIPDLSERIKILPNPDEEPHIDLQEQGPFKPSTDWNPFDEYDADQLTGFLEDREPFKPSTDRSPRDVPSATRLTDLLEEDREPLTPLSSQSTLERPNISRLTDFLGQEDREPFKPFGEENPFDRYGADQLTDFPGHEPFKPFADQDPVDRFRADRLTDFLEQEDREPFRPFGDKNPFDRYGADQLTDFPGHEPFKPFADQSSLNRFGGEQLTSFPGHEPFKPIAETPQWMKNAFTEPPKTASLMNQQPHNPFGDKLKWKK